MVAPTQCAQDVSWASARSIAHSAPHPRRAQYLPVDQAAGAVLAEPLRAQTALPPRDAAAMDGWAVAGPGPWRVIGEVVAGDMWPDRLSDGTAVAITTGAPAPEGVCAVVRREDGVLADGSLRLDHDEDVGARRHIRPAAEEAQCGEELLAAGARLNPVALGLAAAAGYDMLLVHPRPVVKPFILGDELLTQGPARNGMVRDALGPQLPSWLNALGAIALSPLQLPDRLDVLGDALSRASTEPEHPDVLITTGGSAAGPCDHVHRAVSDLGGLFVVDGVQVRPGHPMALALLPGDVWLVVLPGNPLAACTALLTLLQPLLRGLQGLALPVPDRARLATAVDAHGSRLVPVTLRAGLATPVSHAGSGMLRGLAGADAMAVVPDGGAGDGAVIDVIGLPWSS